ncbi:N-acetyltransferase [Streptomyces spiroverticillatus]|uniref:N-acetyltransferase n=1 Tax=Streptomyces finlayi TaxID=67296 RepID=A0A919CCL9_9ACTN|nr:GNAT family protein [Streptomyces finlayi]GHA24323.1 N-acetyltransferase [Streptomyces spiroverticillatus]GHD05939.1 N-acetyltransferase [Streptomyces finlayi]
MFAKDLGAVEGGGKAELRPLEPWQAEEFWAHIQRGSDFIGQYVGLPDVVRDLESARALLQRYAEKAAADRGRMHGIWLDGTLVGAVTLRLFDAEARTCEVGCWLEPAGAGKGLVTRACREIIDWAVRVRGIHRVEWICDVENLPSSKVAKRLGMRRDGVLREAYFFRGVWRDEEVWSVLGPEWLEGR